MLKTLNTREFKKILRNNDYILVRTKGGHSIYKDAGSQTKTIVVPTQLNKMICQRLIKQYNLAV